MKHKKYKMNPNSGNDYSVTETNGRKIEFRWSHKMRKLDFDEFDFDVENGQVQ